MIIGPSNLVAQKDIKTKKIVTAKEMFNEVKKSLPVDVAICTAAVSDFKPSTKNKNKIKKDQNDIKSINLEKNRDILEYLSKSNKHRPKLVVGFSAETENLNKNSILKMKKKNCDLIIANDVSEKSSGFNSDYNKVSIIDNSGSIQMIKKSKKSYIASKIAEVILDKLLIDDRNFN